MTIAGGTWTYSGNPAASSLDQVRYLIGDTDTDDQLLSDEEILWSISSQGNVYSTAALCVGTIIAQGQLVDKKVGDLEIAASQRVSQYQALEKSLIRRISLGAVAFAGGISVSDKQARREDTDRVEPAFRIGIHDDQENPQSGERGSQSPRNGAPL